MENLWKKMKNGIKFILIGIVIFASFSFVLYPSFNASRPEGKQGEEAERLAKKMLEAVGNKEWVNTEWVSWDFPGGHHYVWNKKRSLVYVSWKKNEVYLVIDERDKSKVLQKGKPVVDGNRKDLIEKAWKYFCNDSFWLAAPFKIYDEGTSRAIVPSKKGKNLLLVSYDSGGVTPGDAYLWELTDEGMPLNFKMWVSIIPIGGVKATWSNWITKSNGVKFSTKHKLFWVINLTLKNIKTGNSFKNIGWETDFFPKSSINHEKMSLVEMDS